MKTLILALVLLIMAGCASVDYSPGKVYQVTGGYVEDSSSHDAGDEFLFSLIPPEGQWGYARGKPWFKTNRGYISFINPSFSRVEISWNWMTDVNLKSDIAEIPYLLPWIDGVHPTMERMPYVPSERQIKSGDWDQPGYRRTQWRQFRYFGKKPYYCMTSLSKSREGMIQYGATRQTAYNAYWYNFGCPFQLADGRKARFIVRTVFSITDEQLAKNPKRVEENIEYINQMLEPTWNSLVIMPQAYQFDEPVSGGKGPQG